MKRCDLVFLFFFIKLVAWSLYFLGLVVGVLTKNLGVAITIMLLGIIFQLAIAVKWELKKNNY